MEMGMPKSPMMRRACQGHPKDEGQEIPLTLSGASWEALLSCFREGQWIDQERLGGRRLSGAEPSKDTGIMGDRVPCPPGSGCS